MQKVTIPGLIEKKQQGEPITMLTAFDLPFARLLDQSGVDLILVGDSLGMVALGLSSTVPVTMEDMIHHTKAVRHGVERALLVGDMPFMSFNVSREETIRNAGRLMQEAGCDAVKVEGGQGSVESLEAVSAIVQAGIPVVGHLGLTPQTAGLVGGFKVQGKTAQAAVELVEAAIQLEEAGCFALVLECVPSQVAEYVARQLAIPVLGIGAGSHCDGQVLVTHDLLNLTAGPKPRFVRAFAKLDQIVGDALEQFHQAVQEGSFPGKHEAYPMSDEAWMAFQEKIQDRPKRREVIKIPKAS